MYVCLYAHFRLNETKDCNINTADTASRCILFKYSHPPVTDNALINANHFAYEHNHPPAQQKTFLPHPNDRTFKIQLLFHKLFFRNNKEDGR